MKTTVHVQYMGFKAKPKLREYTFLVTETETEPREFKLTIANDAFLAHRARYQDGPSICAHRVQRELDGKDRPGLKTHCAITDAELEEFRSVHSPKPRRSLMYKPPREAY